MSEDQDLGKYKTNVVSLGGQPIQTEDEEDKREYIEAGIERIPKLLEKPHIFLALDESQEVMAFHLISNMSIDAQLAMIERFKFCIIQGDLFGEDA